MMLKIARKEFTGLVRDGRLWVLGLSLALLLAVVAGLAHQERQASENERRQTEVASRHQWDHQGDKNPHRAAHFGLYVFKPRSALASIDPGVDAQAGQALWLEPHKRNMALFTQVADEPPGMGLGAFTPAFLLFALVPLLIVVLGHGCVTQEREAGTLRMLHACGLRGRPLVFGKWLGLLGGVCVVLVPVLLFGGWMMAGGDGALACALLACAVLTYYAAWAATTVVVSARSASSRVALLVLVAVWLAWVFVLPRLAASLVQQVAPMQTGAAFWSSIKNDIEHGLPGDQDAASRMRKFDAELLARNGAARLEDLPFGANASRRLFRDACATKVHEVHFGRYFEAQVRQQNQLRVLNLLTPYAAMSAISSSLAKTDLAHWQQYELAAEDYRQLFTTRLDEWDLKSTKGVTSFESRYAGNAQWAAIPPWSYRPPSLSTALAEGALDWGSLALWLGICLVGLGFCARRLNP